MHFFLKNRSKFEFSSISKPLVYWFQSAFPNSLAKKIKERNEMGKKPKRPKIWKEKKKKERKVCVIKYYVEP